MLYVGGQYRDGLGAYKRIFAQNGKISVSVFSGLGYKKQVVSPRKEKDFKL